MSITAADNNPVLITVDTTATTDGRTDNVATPFTADTRAWRYNDGIVATILGGASVTGFGLEFEPQGGHVVTVDLEAGASISQTLLPANTTGTDALSLIGSGNNVTYIGNGTVSSTVASGVVLTQTQAGAGDLIANVNNNISTTANGSVGALIVDQLAASGTGNVTVNLAGDVTVSQTGNADTYGGIFAKARGTGGNASVTLGSTIGTSTVLANGTGIAGVQCDSLAGVASVLNGLGTSSISVTGSGSNSGIFAASGAKTIGTHAVLVTTGANSTISVTGGDDNSGIFARNYTDDPNTGNDVVSTGNITITASSGSTITVGSPGAANQEGIGAYTHAVTGTATDITVVASIGGSISVTGNTAAGINARQQAAGGTGDVTVTTNSGRTIDITDTVSGSASFGIHATNAGSGLVSVTSASTITATGVGASDIVGISASGNAGVTVNMPDGQIGTNSDRVRMGIDAAANGASGDIDVTAAAIFSSGDAVRADASTAGNIHITVNGALDASNGIGVHLIGGTDNTVDSTAAISGSVGVQVNGGTTTLTAGANITGTASALDITGGTLVLQGSGISDLGNVHNDGVFEVNRNDAFTIGGVISGSGAFQQNGAGITNLNGANTYTGETFLNAGTTGLNSNTSLGATGAGTTAADAAILAYAPGVTIAEAITLAGTTLGVTFDQTGGSAMQSGVIDGTGPLNKTGIGTLIFTNIATYTGPTNVNAGTLQVDGSIVNSATTVHSGGTLAGSGTTGAVTVQSGGTLAGSGTTGAVTVESGGTLSPGASPDILTTGDLDLQSGSNFVVEISGATPGLGGYDQVVVNGSVTLAGTLSTSLLASFHPATGSALTIIDNDGSDAVSGTFAGLAEGAQFTQGGSTYSITYAGGDGNDVVLTALNDPAVLANVDPTASYTEKSAPVPLDTAPLIAVTDPDGATLVGATVHITAGTFVGDGDILSAITAGTSITASFDDTTETLTLSGLDSLANYQQVLQSVTFVSTSGTPMNSGANPSRTIEWQLNDGSAVNNLSTVQTTNLAITPANERPFLLNVALTAAYAPGTQGSVLSPALQTGDVDSATYASATVQITDGYLTGDELFVNLTTASGFFQVDNGAGGLTTTNISVQSNSFGRLVLAGADTPAHYQEVLDAVSYRSTAVDPGNGGHNPTRTISWQVNDGTAASPLFQVPTPFATGTNPTSVAAGDLNGDSIPDLAVANQGGADVSILLGNGDGTFAGTAPIGVGGAPASLAIGDLNGDGILDLAVANNAANNVSVLLGNGNGTFAGTPPIAVAGAPASLAIGDLNGDGILDLAVANNAANNVSVLLGNGNGTFAGTPPIAVGGAPQSLAIGDLNGDGILDLAVANNATNNVSVLLGNGNGSFAATPPIAVGGAPESLAIGDLNGDRILDLAVANNATNNVSVLLGNGNGSFAATPPIAAGTNPHDVAIADLNGDGWLDLAVANQGSNNVSVLLGNGNGGFAAAPNVPTGIGPVSLAVADLDHDGGADLVIPNFTGNNVAVVLNNGTNMSPAATTVLHFDRPPTIDLDQSAPGTGFATTFTENGAAVPIANANVQISDPDNAVLASATIVLTNARPGDSLFANGALPGGIASSVDTSVAGQITLTLFNAAVFADYQTALSQVRFSNSGDNPDPADRDITVTANDGDFDGPAAHATIHVVPVNRAPVLGGDHLVNITAGSTAAVTTADLTANDPDNSPAQLVYAVTGTSHGSVHLNGAPTSSFTQQNLIDKAVSFQSDGGHDDGSFSVSLTDGIAAPQGATVHVTAAPNLLNNVTGFNMFGSNTGDYFIVQEVADTKTVLLEEVQNNAVVAPHLMARVGANWVVDGAGNFDGDADNDLVWHRDHNGVRELLVLQYEGGTLTRGIALGNVGVDWNVDGTGDFNHDGTTDILMRRDVGDASQLEMLEMKNGTVQSPHILGNMGRDWQVDGVRDFNGDGTDDILLHRDVAGTRFLRTLEMQNDNVSVVHDFGPMGADWQIDAAGDFNHDGTSDILIHRDVGGDRQLRILEMHGGVTTSAHDIGAVGTDWFVDGVGDFTNDGTDDIAMHRDAGGTRTLETLEIHNSAVTAAHVLGPIGLDWLVY